MFPRSDCGFVSVWMVENCLAESRTEETKRSQKEVRKVCCGTGLRQAGWQGSEGDPPRCLRLKDAEACHLAWLAARIAVHT